MNQLRTRLQDASKAWLPMILTVYILCQPLVDVLTGLGAEFGHPITVGVVIRSLVVALVFLYAVFVSDFPGKKRWMVFAAIFVGYLILFMAYMFTLGGFSLAISNVKETVKTFFAPFVLLFLWSVYKQYGYLVTTEIIAWTGALYASVIPIAALTSTSFHSYGNAGMGYRGWFYAANEVGCIMALTAPFTICHCVRTFPTVTKKTWWKGALSAWSLIAVAISANFLGTKIIFGFTALYCAAAFIWLLVQAVREPSREHIIQTAVMGAMTAVTLGMYFGSPFQQYFEDVYNRWLDRSPEATVETWNEAIAHACQGTWLYEMIKNNDTFAQIDQILSRRFISASPAMQVYTEGGVLAKLLGIGYATAPSYSRESYFMVELDPLAMLLRHGIVGFVIYYVPYLAFVVWSIVQFFKHPTQRLGSLRYSTALYCSLAGFAISVLAGHALVSPAVATFILVVGLQLWDQTQAQNKLSKSR